MAQVFEFQMKYAELLNQNAELEKANLSFMREEKTTIAKF